VILLGPFARRRAIREETFMATKQTAQRSGTATGSAKTKSGTGKQGMGAARGAAGRGKQQQGTRKNTARRRS
jgi:hypothetical protein